MQHKKSILYFNTVLFIMAAFLAVDTFSVRGHELIRSALAAIDFIQGEGGVNYVARFVGAAPLDPSNQIGNSIIYDDGNSVGIGTTSPARRLHIYEPTAQVITRFQSASTISAKIRIMDGNTTNEAIAPAIAAVGNNLVLETNGERVRIDSTGNVGIGTTAPRSKLHVAGGSTVPAAETGSLIVTGSTTAMRLVTGVDNTSTMYSWIQSVENGVAYRALSLNPSSGNVGIGTTAPGTKLDVVGGNIRTDGAVILTPRSTDPLSPVNGMMWMRQ